MTTGYGQPGYARSLAEFGEPLEFPGCGGWVLQRKIPAASVSDAMGCYPLFCCRDWTRLSGDLEEAGGRLVSLTLVTDPFGNYDESLLGRCFPDKVVAFKKHLLIDLSQPVKVSKHHRYYTRRSLQKVRVHVDERKDRFADEWCGLYDVLIDRHKITGIRAFSRTAFAAQLALGGMTILRAETEGRTVGAHLWLEGPEGVAYSHLAAFNDEGYQNMASYALYQGAIDHFTSRGFRFMDLGSDAGVSTAGGGGLGFFKRGWSNAERMVYLCGRVFDQAQYEELAVKAGHAGSAYFPAYRAGEF